MPILSTIMPILGTIIPRLGHSVHVYVQAANKTPIIGVTLPTCPAIHRGQLHQYMLKPGVVSA